MPDTLKVALVHALRALAQAEAAAEIAGDVGEPVRAGEQHEALDRVARGIGGPPSATRRDTKPPNECATTAWIGP